MATKNKAAECFEEVKTEVLTEAEAAVENELQSIEADERSVGFCVYIGPSITGVIQSGTIYRGDKMQVLARLGGVIEKYPPVSTLIVSGDALPEARVKVKTPGNLLYVTYSRLGRK